jgi:PHD/YefM family antitoxin component YafN of YafNO toxin-antitoxin module
MDYPFFEVRAVKTVNALTIRNNLGRVLQELDEKKEPILVTKGRQVRAVLITPEDYQRRFIDRLAEERKQEWIRKLDELRAPRLGEVSTMDVLRELRGGAS